MSNQSGKSLVVAEMQSTAELRADHFEEDYFEALRWRRRIKDRRASLADCRKDVLLLYFDALARAATAWRGKLMAGEK